jgi:hypothetical protein
MLWMQAIRARKKIVSQIASADTDVLRNRDLSNAALRIELEIAHCGIEALRTTKIISTNRRV